MNTLTTDTVRNLTTTGLRLLAEAIVFYIDSLEFMPDSGLYGDPQASLHVVALEMNRRHGHASEQQAYDVPNAVDTICFAQYDDGYDVTTVQLAQAYGVLVDKGDDDDWNGVEHFAYTPQRVLDILHGMALDEVLKRSLREYAKATGRTDSPAFAVAPF